MTEMIVCDEFKAGIGELFTCIPHGEYKKIRTPYLYPDGDNVDIFCKANGDVIAVTDLAETMRWLRMQSLVPRRTVKQRQLIEDIVMTHGVEFYRGMLIARCRPGDSLSEVVNRVAQAALRVSDLWFTFKTRSVDSITDDVSDYLTEQKLSFTRQEKLAGRSGKIWTVDFHVRTAEKSSLVNVLKTSNKSTARSVVEHALAGWYDLNFLAAGPEALSFISLFDDTINVWSEEDFKLIEPLSTIAYWSRPDEFSRYLKMVA